MKNPVLSVLLSLLCGCPTIQSTDVDLMLVNDWYVSQETDAAFWSFSLDFNQDGTFFQQETLIDYTQPGEGYVLESSGIWGTSNRGDAPNWIDMDPDGNGAMLRGIYLVEDAALTIETAAFPAPRPTEFSDRAVVLD